ncbi:MAG: SAM-dependent chlorinase/fluorinase [Candidatus Omnitrophica bacterium]|nr:SAM-dependent chlorinase/fluorinase [Candidatus Omnitrophota bacterium]
MGTIGVITDFGSQDHYVGIMKAVMLDVDPKANIIDIVHEIEPGNLRQAAFVLYKSYSFFPKKTVFLAVVDPEVGSGRLPVAIKTRNYYFVGPDNGVLSMAVYADEIVEARALTNSRYFLKNVSRTFHGRDIFAPVSAYLAKGGAINRLGPRIGPLQKILFPQAKLSKKTIEAEVLYIDRFGNLVTNLEKRRFLDCMDKKKFVARINKKKFSLLADYYAEHTAGTPFFIEGGFSLLEVSLKNASARDYFKAHVGTKIHIRCV